MTWSSSSGNVDLTRPWLMTHRNSSHSFAGLSVLVVAWLTAVRDLGLNPIMGICVCVSAATALYSLVHGLHMLTAASTQPSTLHGTTKWMSTFAVSNNNEWCWWMWMIAYGGFTSQVNWLGLRVENYLWLSLHHQLSLMNSRSSSGHDDRTINVNIGVIIITIIIIKFSQFLWMLYNL